MTTGYVTSSVEPEHRLMTQDSKHYQEVLESLVDRKSETKNDEQEEEGEGHNLEDEQDNQLKRPRRKDTPVLNSPPQLPGVKQLKAERQTVHLEDEEKDVKN